MSQTMIRLIANDGKVVEVEQDVASKSNMLKDLHGDVPLSQINGRTIEKIMEYCTKYKDEEFVPKGDTEVQRIDLTQEQIDYMNVDDKFLLEILTGANFLDIPGLVDIICQKIANSIRGKTPAQIREIYSFNQGE